MTDSSSITQATDQWAEPPLDDDALPVCLNCLEPVDPLDKTCPHCAYAVGQLTPYLPWESIRWEVDVWEKMWEQIWRPGRSLLGRVFRFLIILWYVPVLLIGLPFVAWQRWKHKE